MPNINVAKYIKILDRSSKEFRKRTNEIRKEAGVPENTKCDFTTIPNKEMMEKLLKDFFIPVTRMNIMTLHLYLGPKDFHKNYAIAYIYNPDCKEKYIQIKITGKVSAKEWEQIRKRVRELTKLTAKNNLGLHKQPTEIKRKWDNLDLYLEIYKMYKNGLSLKRIHDEIPKIKQRLQIKRTTSYTYEETRRLLKTIKNLIDTLEQN